MSTSKQGNTVKKSFGGVALFYFLVAFEFFYMAGPFAIYFYSIYSPVLNFFNKSPIFSFLNSFFLPHAVRETSSAIINAHAVFGAVLAIIGFFAFCFGAFQVYYNKLAKKGVVTGGIYNFVRHPQYISFIVCSFGLLILWPRYIVLIMFTTMLFAYYLLARVEEKECEEKFGQSYIYYKNKTAMFLPFKFPNHKKTSALSKSKCRKISTMICLYFSSLIIVFGIAKGLNVLSINSLYAVYEANSASISLCEIEYEKLVEILNIALANDEVKLRIENFKENSDTKYLNYVLPTEWFAAEIPMNGLEYRAGHRSPSDYNSNLYKIIFTKAEIRENKNVTGKEIVTNVFRRAPIVEVWVDLTAEKVMKILEIPNEIKYQDIPVAVY